MQIPIDVDFATVPIKGSSKLLVRLTPQAKSDVDRAARIAGLTQSQFMRVALIQVAQKLIEIDERPVPIEDSPELYSDLPPGVLRDA